MADAINVFKRNKLNLTWIESFPVPGSDRAYMFFAEVETHPTESRFRRAMAALERKALRLEVLGASGDRGGGVKGRVKDERESGRKHISVIID